MADKLDRKEVEKIAKQVVNDTLNEQIYGSFQVQQHTHNGLDSPQLDEDNVLPTTKLYTQVTDTNTSGGTIVESHYLLNISNPRRIAFFGRADNLPSGANTKSGSITGEAVFGRCYGMTGAGSNPVIDTSIPGISFVQSCTFSFIDLSGMSPVINMGIDGAMGALRDGSSAYVFKIELISYTDRLLIFQITLANNWRFAGNILIE